jgi:hypothetical protein
VTEILRDLREAELAMTRPDSNGTPTLPKRAARRACYQARGSRGP